MQVFCAAYDASQARTSGMTSEKPSLFCVFQSHLSLRLPSLPQLLNFGRTELKSGMLRGMHWPWFGGVEMLDPSNLNP